MNKCLVIGATMLDVILEIDSLPNQGADIYAKSQKMNIGGCAFNVADILKHFKASYDLFAPIGSGSYAEIIKNKLKTMGHTSLIEDKTSDNGYCLCLVDATGERTFITFPGIECQFKKEWFDKLDSSSYSYVYISGYEIEGEGGDNIIEFLANNPQIKIFYGPGPRINYIDSKKHERLFKLNPIIHLNEEESKKFTTETTYQGAAKILYSKTKSPVIITLGEKGSYFYENGEIFGEPISTKVVDTIGAGDSNLGAIIAGYMLGYDWKEILTLANKVSAKVVSVQGSTLNDEEFGGI